VICLGSGLDTLTGGIPVNGTGGGIGSYSGTGVVDPLKGIFDPSVSGVGKFAIRYTFKNPVTGCSGQATDTLTVLGAPKVLSLTDVSTLNVCDTTPKLVVTGDASVTSYEWFRNDTLIANAVNAQYTATKSGLYRVRLFNVGGCYHDTSLTLALKPHPRANFAVASICKNLTVYFKNLSRISDGSGLVYLWDFGEPSSGAKNGSTDTDGVHQYGSTGVKTVKLITESVVTGCLDSITVAIVVDTLNPNANFIIVGNQPYCLNESLIFEDSSYLPGKVIKEYTWEFYDVGGILIKRDTGSVVLERFPVVGNLPTRYSAVEYLNTGDICLVETKRKTFVISPSTPVTYVREQGREMCYDASPFVLTGGSTVPAGQPGRGYYTGQGVTGDTTGGNTFDPKLGGVGEDQVSYVFTNQYGCKSTASVDYVVNGAIPLTSHVIYAREGDLVTLNQDTSWVLPFTFGPEGITSITADSLGWYWSPGTGLSSQTIPSPTLTAKENGVYTLQVTSPKGCISKTTIEVRVRKTLFVPNVFTPNGDGIHDTWYIKGIDGYPQAEVFIFNRWGEQLFYSRGYGTEFNGYYRGKPLPAGTYYYLIKYNGTDGTKPATGPLTIIY
jgi:gliding motility-associated-like protein